MLTIEERCKLATDCLPVAEYRTRLEALHEELLALRKDAERYRKMRDLCAWSMMSRPGLVRLVFRLSGDFNFDDETGHEMDVLIDATHAAAPAVG